MKKNKTQKIISRCLSFVRRLAAPLLAAVLALSLSGCEQAAAGLVQYVEDMSAKANEAFPQSEQAASTSEGLKLHFIDVGQALSVLIECDGQYMLYDGGNVDDGSLLVSYLQRYGVQQFAAVFCSHTHEDHIGGLAAALAVFPSAAAYCPVAQNDSTCFKNYEKYANKQGLSIEVPAAGTTWQLGGATLRLLGPLSEYETDSENNSSLVLRIDYGQTSFLLTGDMEADAERDLVESGADLKADVLQVGHHGSYTSTSYVFLNAVMPEMGVISCGANNDYGHPHDEVLSRLRDAGADTLRTDLMGTIVIASDGANYTVSSERSASAGELNPTTGGTAGAEAAAQGSGYIGNVKSKTFHLPTCSNLPAEQNRIIFDTYDEAIAAGYKPCGGCKPK